MKGLLRRAFMPVLLPYMLIAITQVLTMSNERASTGARGEWSPIMTALWVVMVTMMGSLVWFIYRAIRYRPGADSGTLRRLGVYLLKFIVAGVAVVVFVQLMAEFIGMGLPYGVNVLESGVYPAWRLALPYVLWNGWWAGWRWWNKRQPSSSDEKDLNLFSEDGKQEPDTSHTQVISQKVTPAASISRVPASQRNPPPEDLTRGPDSVIPTSTLAPSPSRTSVEDDDDLSAWEDDVKRDSGSAASNIQAGFSGANAIPASAIPVDDDAAFANLAEDVKKPDASEAPKPAYDPRFPFRNG